MSNSILTPSMITNEAMRILENNLSFAKGVNRNYDDRFGVEGAKIGETLNIRLPARYVGTSGAGLSLENHVENYIALTLGTQFHVDVSFTSKDLALSLDDFSERVLAPAMATLANKVDYDGLTQILSVYNSVGTAGGGAPSTLLTYLQASAKLKQMACPSDNMRSMVIDPTAEATIVNGLTTLFNPSEEISDQYKDGTMGRAIGFKWSCDQNVNTWTMGQRGGTPLVDGGGSISGATLATKGWTSSAANRLKKGDIFTIANVYAVNPQSRQSTGALQQFVVTSDFSSDGSGNGNVSISPSITTSGQFQTVNSAPVDGAALAFVGAASAVGTMNVAYHRDACVLGSADLYMPKGVDMSARVSSKKVGLSVRMVRQYDINNDSTPARFDILYGYALPYPQLACRILA